MENFELKCHPNDLVQVVYKSSESHEMSPNELADLLKKARAYNESCGITGLLVHCNQNFLQVLEGKARDVSPLLEKIRQDKRHVGFKILWAEPIHEKEFSEWSMGFAEAGLDAQSSEGYKEFDQIFAEAFDSNLSIHQVLMGFRNGQWGVPVSSK